MILLHLLWDESSAVNGLFSTFTEFHKATNTVSRILI